MLECSSVLWDLYCGIFEWAFSCAKGLSVKEGTRMAAPEAGRGFSHDRTHLRSRHDGHQKPRLWLFGGNSMELFCTNRKPSELDLYHISPFAHPAS